MSVRLLIADDHPIVRAGFEGMLAGQRDIEVVGEAADGREAVDLARKLEPDVVLMDLRMPELEGVAAIEEIRARLPDTHVLVLTTYDSDADILRSIEAGATGYLLKDAPREELFHAIRATARGEPALASRVTARLIEQRRKTAREELSDREAEILRHVAKGESNKEIGRSLHISEATVKTHLIHTFDKLEVEDRTAAVTAALEKGLIRLGG